MLGNRLFARPVSPDRGVIMLQYSPVVRGRVVPRPEGAATYVSMYTGAASTSEPRHSLVSSRRRSS
jgi:hypothetical protein